MAANDELTNLEYALLGLVSMAPLSGYDVHKIFATTPLAHFSSSPGAIYPALRRLEQRGLLQAALDTTRETRPRRVFSIAPAGEEVLGAWLRQPVTREEIIRSYGSPVLRFALAGGRLSPTETISYLRGWRQVLAAYLEELHGHRVTVEAQPHLPIHGLLALEHGIKGFQAELDWIDEAIARIARQPVRRARAARR